MGGATMLNMAVGRRMEDAALFTIRHPRVAFIAQRGFAALAGLAATFRPLPAEAACCTGPNGSPQCASEDCAGYFCWNHCSYTYGFCGSASCWTSWCGGTCCDCECGNGVYGWYCYCYRPY